MSELTINPYNNLELKRRFTMPILRVVAVVVTLAILIVVPIFWTFQSVGFKPFQSGDYVSVFTQLLIIAVFMERALEFFINLWREPGKDDLAHRLEDYERELSKLEEKGVEDAEIESMENKVQELRYSLQLYGSLTFRISLWSSFLFGLLISTVGVRALQSVVGDVSGLAQPQQTIFHFIDVLLTGCLISGGSEGIHKIAGLYNKFIESSAKKVKKEA